MGMAKYYEDNLEMLEERLWQYEWRLNKPSEKNRIENKEVNNERRDSDVKKR